MRKICLNFVCFLFLFCAKNFAADIHDLATPPNLAFKIDQTMPALVRLFGARDDWEEKLKIALQNLDVKEHRETLKICLEEQYQKKLDSIAKISDLSAQLKAKLRLIADYGFVHAELKSYQEL